MASSEFSPRGRIFDVLNFLPQGHEKALKQAVYNTIAILLVMVIFVAAISVKFILEPFLRPLLWALLFGSVLHPLKHTLTVIFKRWIQNLEENGTPFSFGVFMLPFKIVDKSSEGIGQLVIKHSSPIYAVSICFASLVIFLYIFPENFFSVVYDKLSLFFDYCTFFLEYFHGATFLIWTLVIGYVILVSLMWKPGSFSWIGFFSPIIWVIFIIYLACIAGPLRVPLLIFYMFLMVIGFVTELQGNDTPETDETDNSPNQFPPLHTIKVGWALIIEKIKHPPVENLMNNSTNTAEEPVLDSNPSNESIASEASASTSQLSPPTDPPKMSNFYLQTLLWACIILEAWIHPWSFHILPIPIVYLVAKVLGSRFGLWTSITNHYNNLWIYIKHWFCIRQRVLVPGFIKGLLRMMIKGDRMMLVIIKNSLDTVTSIVVMVSLLVIAVVGAFILAFQVYGESVHLITLASSVVNKTIVNNPELQELLPDSLKNVQSIVDSVIGDAYVYSRQMIVDLIRRFIDEKDTARAAMLEKELLELMDRVYNQWLLGGSNSTHASNAYQTQKAASFDNLLDGLKTLNFDLILTFLKENIGILMTILDSLYSVVKGNLSIVFTALTAIFSVVFGGGTAVLNFLIDLCVFSTALFYLLSSSGESYKPWEMFTSMFPSGTKLGKAIEESVYGVFSASFKMACFYGMFAWFMHTLFDVKFVFIPAVISALCGAIPFLGPYWACIPAVLELWLVQKQLLRAILMFVFHLLPSSFVDSAIYAEIKGGHPYLTGLAIAGGIFCFGFEGALFGPLWLCFFCVLINLYSSMVHDVPLDETGRRSSRHILKRMFTID